MQWTTATGKTTIVTPSNLLGDDMLRRGSPGTSGDSSGSGSGSGRNGQANSPPPPRSDHPAAPPDKTLPSAADPFWDHAPPPDEYPF
jgi:hypothetical protein